MEQVMTKMEIKANYNGKVLPANTLVNVKEKFKHGEVMVEYRNDELWMLDKYQYTKR